MQQISFREIRVSDGGELDNVTSLKAAVLVRYCTGQQGRTSLCSLRADSYLHNPAVGEHMLNDIYHTEN